MVSHRFRKRLLGPEDIPPSRDDFEVIGAFNPAAVQARNEVVLLVRVAERPRERREGFTPLPRWCPRLGVAIDWVPDHELETIDSRVVRRRADGLIRLTFLSHLRVVRCGDGRAVHSITDVLFKPETEWEEFGVEDPRISPIHGHFFVTYVAVSRHGVVTALASTLDFVTFVRHGIVFGPENKDVVLFPEQKLGELMALHRPSGGAGFARPEIWLARSSDFLHWGRHAFVHGGIQAWESGRVGAGPPPLLLPQGWLVIYHGSRRPSRPGEVGAYAAGALLLDRADPALVLRRTLHPLLRPEESFEREGFVPEVVFPTGMVQKKDALLVYYGAADTSTGVIELAIRDVVDALT